MLMFGVIMSGDTWGNKCACCKMRRLHEVNARFIFSMMKRCSPVRADVRILHSKEVLG